MTAVLCHEVDPVRELFPGPEDDPALFAAWEKYAARLESIVAFGTHVLAWSLQSPMLADNTGVGDAGLVAALKYRWALELASSIAVQVRAGWSDPAATTLRALFETSLTSRFLLFDKTQMAERGRAFTYFDMTHRLRAIERMTPGTLTYKQLSAELARDDLLSNPPAIDPDRLAIEAEKLKATLELPAYQAMAKVVEERTARGRPPKEWYSAVSGASNLEELARLVGMAGRYQIFYRSDSRTTHGLDILRGTIGRSPNGLVDVKSLRRPRELHSTSHLASLISIDFSRLMVDTFLPERTAEWKAWWLVEVRPSHVGGA